MTREALSASKETHMSEKRPTTIQFFLPEGEPRGIRIAEITTRIAQAVFVPWN